MKFIFFSPKNDSPILVYSTHKMDRDGNVSQEGRYITFEDHYFETDAEELAQFIQERRNFGVDYFLVEGRAIAKPTPSNIRKMETASSEVARQGSEAIERVGALESKVDRMVGIMSTVMDKLEQLTTVTLSVPEETEQKNEEETQNSENEPKKEKSAKK